MTWQLSAACRDAAPAFDAWIDGETPGEREDRHKAAIRLCWACPVRVPCAEFRDPAKDFEVMAGHPAAVSKNVPAGGGDMPRVTGRPKAPIVHGTPNGYRAHLRADEKACDLCREAEGRRSVDRKAKAS